MFKVHRFVFGVVFVLGLAAAGYSQPVAPRVGLINMAAFYDEKSGIATFISAEKLLNYEFAKEIKELEDGNAKLASIAAELQKATISDANDVTLQAKKSEGKSLQHSLEVSKTNLDAKMDQRRKALITFEIGKAVAEFSKKNNYAAIFDATKVADGCIFINLANITDVTKDFITFYNAKAAAVPVK